MTDRPIVCTLVEGRYFLGVAALINSLEAIGFDGLFVVGYRGEAPADFRQQLDRQTLRFGVDLRPVPEGFSGHLTNLKPHWMLALVEELGCDSIITYLDPDICLMAPWRSFEDWIGGGVGVAENSSTQLRRGSWRVKRWQKLFANTPYTVRDDEPAYINGGFVGVGAASFSFLNRWKELQDIVSEQVGGSHVSILRGGVAFGGKDLIYNPLSMTDQDALNIAVRTGEEDLGILSLDGMGFEPGVPFMTHALGKTKPWDRAFLTDALIRGRKPSFADKVFFANCDGPLRPFGKGELMRKRLSLKLACVLRGRGWN